MRVRFFGSFAVCAFLAACSTGPSRGTDQSQYEDSATDEAKTSVDAGRDATQDASRDAKVPDAMPDACKSVEETCNGRDDDCDMRVDEELGMQVCGQGACHVEVVACENGVYANCEPGEPSDEICNDTDDDCDGKTDEGNLDPGTTCTTGNDGICSPGTERCKDGSIQCIANVAAGNESCNGLDDDCDGKMDEGDLDPGAACSTGTSGVCAAGTQRCVAGSVQCVANTAASNETCNDADDDCDGKTDEGNLDPGDNCSTGEPGVCAAGTRRCQQGAIVCVAKQSPSSETCNALDDNCNGTKDEGNPGGGASCNTGKKGICAAGTTACTSGALACNQNKTAAASETCNNGLDDDCDGFVDNGCCTAGTHDCNGAGACECIGTACCGTGCQSAHQNGLGNYFFDCEPLGTRTLTQAAAACVAFTGDISLCYDLGAACDGGTTSAVCSSGASACACWTYAGANTGRVFLNEGSTECLCPLPSDPTWN